MKKKKIIVHRVHWSLVLYAHFHCKCFNLREPNLIRAAGHKNHNNANICYYYRIGGKNEDTSSSVCDIWKSNETIKQSR